MRLKKIHYRKANDSYTICGLGEHRLYSSDLKDVTCQVCIKKVQNVKEITDKRIFKINLKRTALYNELSDFANVTPARRIRINILLDALAEEEKRILHR